MKPSEIVTAYYAACETGETARIAEFMHSDCVVDEPSFLPYGRVEVVGAEAMMSKVGSVFFGAFIHHGLRDTRFFEQGNALVAVSIWQLESRHGGERFDCHYHEYFETRDGKISLMRPFYHAVLEMDRAVAAARAAGVPVDVDML